MQSDPVPIDVLGEDLLLEIFLRLPSLATLIRAALTCRAWRSAVASSPSFRRRFRSLHRAPLLGLFVEPELCSIPVFTPVYRRDRDVLAAIGRGDFALTSLFDTCSDASYAPLQWSFCDSGGGYILLANRDAGLFAAVNPLSRYNPDYIRFPRVPETEKPHHDTHVMLILDVHLLFSDDEDPMSFRLFCIVQDRSRVRGVVFASDTRDWCHLPWMELVERVPRHGAKKYGLFDGTQANGFIHWMFKNRKHVLMLDTRTMEFSVLELPPHFHRQEGYKFLVTGTTDRAPCIVYCTESIAGVLIHGVDEEGVKRWIMGGTVKYKEKADLPEQNDALKILGARDGFVYLATSKMILSLCIETMELEKLFPRIYTCYVNPYVMAWPPSILGNHGSFAAIHDGASNA